MTDTDFISKQIKILMTEGYFGDEIYKSFRAMHFGQHTNIKVIGEDVYYSHGSKYDGTSWIATATASAIIKKSGGAITFYANTGLTEGVAFTPTATITFSSTGTLNVDHIEELTAAHGVTVDGVTLKDGGALTITGGTNTFNLTNGTAVLDVAAACTVNVDANLTVTTALTNQGAAGVLSWGGAYTLTINQNLTLAGASGKSLTLTTNLTNQGAAGVLNWGGAYTLTIPATGTVALLATANTFSEAQAISYSKTNTSSSLLTSTSNPLSSADGTHNTIGYNTAIYPKVSTGITNSGAVRSLEMSVLRNIIAGDGNGTLSGMYGANIQVGHYNGGICTPTTTGIYGFVMNIYNRAGTAVVVEGFDVSMNLSGGTTSVAIGLNINDISGASSNFAIKTNAGNIVFNEGGDGNTDVRMEGDTLANLFMLDASADAIGVNVAAGSITGLFHIDQSSTTGAKPVLTLDQADVSEEIIRYIGTAADNVLTQSLVAIADVASAVLVGYVKVYVQDDGNQITDASYFMPVYSLA